MSVKRIFLEIGKTAYEGPGSKGPLAFHYYEPERVVCGKKMKDWFKFSAAWWHTPCAEDSDQSGTGTKNFPWNQEGSALEIAKTEMDAGMLGSIDANTVDYRTIGIPISSGLTSMSLYRP